jgi:hypothetical protein
MPLTNPDFEAWKAITLLNSFTNRGSPFQSAQYRKDSSGNVQFRGVLTRTSIPSNVTNIFIFPTGYRPPGTLMIPCVYITGVNSEGIMKLEIDTSGQAKWQYILVAAPSGTSVTYFSFNGEFSTLS